jgi:predicted ester cyclase
MKGTHTGPLEFVRLPLAATGRACSSEVIHVFRVVNGKVAEHWAGRDDLAVMRQLGIIPTAQEVRP